MPDRNHHRPFPRPMAASPHELLEPLFADALRACRGRGGAAPRATIESSGSGTIAADPRLVRRALEPLVQRACVAAAEATGSGGCPAVREVIVTVVHLDDRVEIEVADSGPWLSAPVRDWLAAPATAGRGPPAAAGSALSAALAAAAAAGGSLSAVNCPEGGVAITLRLPGRRARVAA